MGVGVEVGEASLGSADLPLVAQHVAAGEQRVVEGLVVGGPEGQVLEALAPGGEELPVEGGRVVVLLDQLDLQIARVGQWRC
jgi:hypothetical protein